MAILKKITAFLKKSGQNVVVSAIIFYALIFSFFCLWKYYNFAYNALDLAIINQVFYNSGLGHFFASSIHPPAYLGDHFSPGLLLLLPIYLIFKKPETLLILQILALAGSAWPLYLIAQKTLNKTWGALFALFWLFNPFVQNINLYEFSFLPFAVFLIFWAFYFYQKCRDVAAPRLYIFAFLLFCFIALLTREDAALVIFLFGPLAFLEKRKLKWLLTPIILAGLYFILALKLTAFFAPTGQYKFLIYYSWLGRNLNEILASLIFQPQLLLKPLFWPGNWEFLLGLFLPLIFLPLASPLYLLLAAGIFFQLAWRAGGASAALLLMSYSALLLPAIFIAAVFSLKKILQENNRLAIFLKPYRSLVFLILIAGVIYSCLVLGPLVGLINKIGQTGLYSQISAGKNELMGQIPKNAAVAATYDFLTPLSSRQNLYSFNYAFLGKQQYLLGDYALPTKTEYLLIDFQDLIAYQLQYGFNPFYQKQYQTAVQTWPKNLAGFGLIDIKGTAALYQKGAQTKYTLIEELPDLPGEEMTPLAAGLDFTGFNRSGGKFQLFWRINFPLKEIYRLKLLVYDDKNFIYEKIYPLAYDLLLDPSFSGKKNIQTNYWFGLDDILAPGNYELKIRLLTLGGGGLEIDPIRSTTGVIDEEIPIGPKISLGSITL